jgi:hypothetical protein
MKNWQRFLSPLVTALFLLGLIGSLAACGVQERLPEVEISDDWRQQGAAAATRAAVAMATAAVQADEARELAGPAAATAVAAAATAAAQGGDSLATAQAAGIVPAVDVDFLRERMTNVQPVGGTLTVTFTDAELNQAIRLAQQVAAQTGRVILIHDAQIRFTSGLMTFSGRVTQPIAAEVRIIFRPMVSNGLLQFEVVDATLGDSSAPTPLLNQAAALLNSTLGEIVSNLPVGYTLHEVVVGEGMITVVARR